MTEVELRQAIAGALKRFQVEPLADAATHLLDVLGYASKKRLVFKPNTLANFLSMFSHGRTLNDRYAMPDEWKSVDFLFQLTDEEVRTSANQQFDFESKGVYNGSIIESYLFLAIELKGSHYSRTALAGITREVNKLFVMPVLILFRHGDTLTLAIINRRLHKREAGKDVLEKVTLIHDIQLANTHRAHIDILTDLSLWALHRRHSFTNFVGLHEAWQKTLDTSELNKRFFQDLANWYFWAGSQVRFPKDAPKDADGRDSVSLIRLITRVIFCWFLKEKGLLPDALFDERKLSSLLKDSNPKESTYYKAILQNLFFATLNQEMDKREFRKDGQNFMVHTLYRYRSLLKDPDALLKQFEDVPFMNGGLFECLDKTLGTKETPVYIRIDGFSEHKDNNLKVPNDLFWGSERTVDLSDSYGDNKYRSAKVAGLVHIFNRYKFTVAENTPIEEEVALDPELLGRVFENLLAAYNPETGATARKQTGSFYTPREIVNYMVDESLIASLKTKLEGALPKADAAEERLRELLTYNDLAHRFTDPEVVELIKAIDNLTILDPACGSGAFPMGILHKLVFVLGKLDPGNHRWKAQQIAKANEFTDFTVREFAISEIEQTFRDNELDYGRKLYLIEKCIYGVDIQPIAAQIAKLRFFISLVVDQRVNPHVANRGIRPLPNLETRFVAANTLVGIERPEQQMLRNPDIISKESELKKVREAHFLAKRPADKRKCREQDAQLRSEIAKLLKAEGWGAETAKELALWDPYDQNASAGFFDAEWMFGITSGFDVTIGNPPYIRADEQSDENKALRQLILESEQYETLWEKWDLFVAFIEKGYKLLKPDGVTTMIVSDAYCHSKYAQKSQNWFLQNSRILRLDFCTDLQIFDAAVHNVIYFFQRSDGSDKRPERRVHREIFGNVIMLPSTVQSQATYRVFFPEEKSTQTFAGKILPLHSICYISVGMVINADEKKSKGAFLTGDLIRPSKDKQHPKAFVEGKNLTKWIFSENSWLEWGTSRAPSQFRRQTFPELYEHSEKLMLPMVGDIRGAIDTQQFYCNHGIFVSVLWHQLANVKNRSLKKVARYSGEKPTRPDLPKREDLETLSRRFSTKYLLGVVNSSAARQFLLANRRNNVQLYPDDWKELPIPDVSQEQQKPIISIVDKILTARRANPKADISMLEADLDSRIEALYGMAS
ncbi:MAG TPA: Eco57I restriction-modification methylase domain-containing protein [Terracidiphilus sp.]|nr:Eco57I restriction-modification methylase domain-containing protein [Terracidiphilus sp.]